MTKKIIKRTATFTIPLKDACEMLGFKYELDYYDDFFMDCNYSSLDHINLGKLDNLKHIFKNQALDAYEHCTRGEMASAMERETDKAIESSLLKIDVVGEYLGLNSEGEEVWVSEPSCVIEANVDRVEDTCTIVIKNPEHLINDLINGEGRFYPHEILIDIAQDSEVKSRIHFLGEYFSIYGDSISSTDDRAASYACAEDEDIEGVFKENLSCVEEHEFVENMTEYLAQDSVTKEIFEKMLIKACKYCGMDKAKVLDQIRDDLTFQNDKLMGKIAI